MKEEKKYEFCRLCGFVREVGKRGICSACGALERAFIPYEHKASERRRMFLKLDVHPVAVHFTISYTAVVAMLYIISIFSTTLLGIPIQDTRDLQIFFLPLLTIGGGITGLIDGRVRFRRLDTPYLKRKIVLGCILVALSLGTFIFHNLDTSAFLIRLFEGICIFSSFAIASYLGWIGAEMICAIVPVGRLKENN